VAVAVPPESAEDFEGWETRRGGDMSDSFGDMLRVYRAYREVGRFDAIQRYGAARARALGIRDEKDVDRLIRQARRG
jgi:hypothetical protein